MTPNFSLLSEISEIVDSLHKTPKYADVGRPMVRVTDVKYGQLDLRSTYKVDDVVFDEFSRRYQPSKGDVIITRVGSYGNTAYVGDTNFCLGQNTAAIIPKINPRYLFLALNTPLLRNQIESSTVGSTQKTLSLKAIGKLEIPRFSSDIEDAIAEIGGQLNDKIQLNHQINQTLEQMAQAIFKSWFVDFEPVKAKIAARERWHALQAGNEPASPVCYAGELEGQPIDVDLDAYMNLAAMQTISGKDAEQLEQMKVERAEEYAELCATAELFPSAMQDTELGEIPAEWRVSKIGEEVKVVGGGTPSTKVPEYWEQGTIHWTSPKDLSNASDRLLIDTERKITERGLSKISSGLLPVNTVLMSSRAPVGYLTLTKIPVAINQGYIAMICSDQLLPEYVMQWAHSIMDDIKQRASGTTFAEISKKNFKVIPIAVPHRELIVRFAKIASSIYSKIELNMRTSVGLEEIREALLPKLLSGELEV